MSDLHHLNAQKKYNLPLNKVIKLICIAAIIVVQLACNHNMNSVPLIDLEVFYEKDADLTTKDNKEVWKDIVSQIDFGVYESVEDYFNNMCEQKPKWKKINALSEIELNNPSLTNINYIWVKGVFYNINVAYEIFENYRGIYFEHIYGREIVFINNVLVGAMKIKSVVDASLPRQYKISNRTLEHVENIVYVRFEISGQWGIGKKANIYIQPERSYYLAEFWNTFNHSVI